MKRYRDEDTTVPDCGYTKDAYLSTVRNARPTTEIQTINGNDTISADKLYVHLDAAAGLYAVTLPDGNFEHEELWIFWVGTGGTFNVTGNLRTWAGLQFDVNGTSAHLKWVASKWELTGGSARPF